jgi:hypothetical protein
MRLNTIIPLILLLAVGLFSCESLITDIPASKLPQTGSKLVVQSFISPQAERIYVAVSESEPLFGTSSGSNHVINDAVVKISDGSKEIEIPYDAYNNNYSIESSRFPIAASKTYYLSVSYGGKKVTAECTVPAKTVTVKSFRFDTAQFNDPAPDPTKFATLKMNWQDVSGEPNFYRVHASMLLEYSVSTKDNPKDGKETRVTTCFNFQWDESSGRSEMQSDKALDGGLFSSPMGKINLLTVMNVDKFALNNPKIKSVTMEVFNTDIHYFQYHRDIYLRADIDNPFSEPSQIYSNIEGGLGCFGAYNSGKLIYLN